MRYIIVFILFFGIAFNGYSVESDDDTETAKAVLLFYVSDLIDWPLSDTSTFFNIGVQSKETYFTEKLKEISSSYTVDGRPIVIKAIDEFKDPENINVIFIDKSYHKDIDQILNYCQQHQILQVTDQLENKRYTVVNFIRNSETNDLGYEVNKTNLQATNLSYQDELLLYGGSINDLRELYNATKELLVTESEKVINLSKEIEQKSNEIELKNNSITNLTTQIDKKRDTLTNLQRTIYNQSDILQKQSTTFKEAEHELLNMQKKYTEQLQLIEEKELLVQTLDSTIQIRENTILTQSNTIEDKDLVIKAKNRGLWLLTFICTTILLLAVLIYRAYFVEKRQKKKLNATLNQLENAQEQLVDSEKMATIGTMAAGVAHEINTPLNYIKGGVYGIKTILADKIGDNKTAADLMKGVDLGVDKAATIVASLNHFSRQSEQFDEDCDIHAIIDNSLAILGNILKSRIVVERNYTKEPFVCQGNEGKIHQVLLNIIRNAAQSIDDEGKITITTGEVKEENQVFIQIEDTGSGIKPENLDKITTPFFTTKSVGDGTGLGLSISKKIISDHNGKLVIESEENIGTSMSIYLPKTQSS